MVLSPHTNKAFNTTRHALFVKPSHGFTIIELTMVIGVISILIAIALPTIKSVRLAAERKKAAIQATLLTQAVIKYKDIYGFWPGQLEVTGDAANANPKLQLRAEFSNMEWTPVIISRFGNFDFEVEINDGSGTTPVYLDGGNENDTVNYLCMALNTIDPENVNDNLYQPNPLNPKQIEFLELENATDANGIRFQDPWGQEFIVFMGLNPQSHFRYTHKINGASDYILSVSNCTAFAFSRGPDGSQSRKYIMTSGVSYDEQ